MLHKHTLTEKKKTNLKIIWNLIVEVTVFYSFKRVISSMGFPGGLVVKKKNTYAMQETWVQSLGQKTIVHGIAKDSDMT